MANYKKMMAELMQVDFNSAAIASVINSDDSTIAVQGHFTTIGDYIALLFKTSDSKMHDYYKYSENTNFANFILSFQVSYYVGSSDICHYDDITKKLPMVIKYNDSSEKYITMGFNTSKTAVTDEAIGTFTGLLNFANNWIEWDSEVVNWEADVWYEGTGWVHETGTGTRETDYVIDYVNGYIQPVVGTSIPYGADITVDYNYNNQTTYSFNFDNLKQGEHPNYEVAIPLTNIKSINIPIVPATYTPSDFSCTGDYKEFQIIFNNWTVTNGDLNTIPDNLKCLPLKIAEGYDDEYYINPVRLAKSSYILGYRNQINLYIGASHFYNKFGANGLDGSNYQNIYLDYTYGCNLAFKEWLKYFCKTMYSLGYTSIIISVSIENLQMPESWKQRLHDGVAAATGWTPPTNFYSPCNVDVQAYITKVVNDCITIVNAENIEPILQLGELWYWWQSFIPGDINTPYVGQPPAFYDQSTKDAYYTEFSETMPIWSTSFLEMTQDVIDVCNWLKGKLGDYSDFMKNLASTNSVKFAILFFPPSVINPESTPPIFQIVNTPFDRWTPSNLDILQIEDYDDLIANDEFHEEIWNFPKNYLGFQDRKVQYFAGFAWEEYEPNIEDQWDLIFNAALTALNKCFECYIWAGTQIRRDSFVPDTFLYTTQIKKIYNHE